MAGRHFPKNHMGQPEAKPNLKLMHLWKLIHLFEHQQVYELLPVSACPSLLEEELWAASPVMSRTLATESESCMERGVPGNVESAFS